MNDSPLHQVARGEGRVPCRKETRNRGAHIRRLLAAVPLLIALFSWTGPCLGSESEAEVTERAASLRPRLDRPSVAPTRQEQPAPRPEAVAAPSPTEEKAQAVEVEVDQEPKAAVAPAPSRIWYGWQNLLVDGAGQTSAIALGVIMAGRDGGASAMGTGLATYVLGGPIVHFAHGNVGKGFGSLALRAGLPASGALAGAVIELRSCGGESFCGLSGGFFGLAVGTVGAIVLDASVLAYKKVPPESTAKRSSRFESLAVLPSLSHDGAGLSVNAAF